MSRLVRLALGAAALAALVFTLRPLAVTAAPEPARPADPQWKPLRAAKPADTPVPPPPEPLTRLQMKERLAKATELARMPTIANAPQMLEMRLTPIKPRLENGTRIVEAKGIDLLTPTAEIPDGVYWLLADDYYWPESSLEIRVQTEKDKLYVADCRVKEVNPSGPMPNTLRIFSPGFSEFVQAEAGHILFAFRGDAGSSTVRLYYTDEQNNWARKMAFYGCDFGKAG